jgi:hypothetical protein
VVTVREYVAVTRSLVTLLVMEPMASIPSYGVEALIGLVGLGSQGHGRAPHPIVGRAIHSPRWAIFGWWVIIPVITHWRCCLVHAVWRRDGVYLD